MFKFIHSTCYEGGTAPWVRQSWGTTAEQGSSAYKLLGQGWQDGQCSVDQNWESWGGKLDLLP